MVSSLLFGPDALLLLAGVVVGLLVVRPRVPPELVLSTYRAQPLTPQQAPGLHRVVTVLAERAELPATPDLYLVASPLLNAFAVGRRDHAALAVTDGLLRRMPDRELLGVLAHEISHVRADDLWVMSLSDSVGRLTHLLAYGAAAVAVLAAPTVDVPTLAVWALVATLALVPTLTTMVQLALSRAREHDADLVAATLTGDPEGLARALQHLERSEGRLWERTMVPRRRAPDLLLLRTHPPTEQRVRRLRELRGELDAVPELRGQLGPRPSGPPAPPARLRLPGVRW